MQIFRAYAKTFVANSTDNYYYDWSFTILTTNNQFWLTQKHHSCVLNYLYITCCCTLKELNDLKFHKYFVKF